MATRDAEVTDNGENGPSGSVVDDQDAMQIFARQLAQLVISQEGKLTPEAQSQIDLRSDEERAKVLDQMVRELTPSGVAPSLWLKWLRGGDSPFISKGLKRPVKLSHGTKKALGRGPASLRPYRERLEKARADLAFAEEALAYQEAMDKSLLTWSVTDHLIRLLGPLFAMGPAWTLVRSVTGHMNDEEAARLTRVLSGDEKQKAIAEYRRLHQEESDKILEALDLFSGHAGFERALRNAIKKVVTDYEPMRQEWVKTGRRQRSETARRDSAHPEAQIDREKALAGLEQQG